MIVNTIHDDESIRQYVMSKAAAKYKPWFSPICPPFGTPEAERKKFFESLNEGNQKWIEAATVIAELFKADEECHHDFGALAD